MSIVDSIDIKMFVMAMAMPLVVIDHPKLAKMMNLWLSMLVQWFKGPCSIGDDRLQIDWITASNIVQLIGCRSIGVEQH